MASSKRSTAPAKSSGTISPAPKATATSSRTRSTSSITSPRAPARITCVIALGSNLGDRAYHLRRAIAALPIRVVRVSSFHDTEPVNAPAGSPRFLNAVVIGHSALAPEVLMEALLALERRLGRVRGGHRNEPRTIDLDLILHGATRMRTPALTLPHPRAHERAFVMLPLLECGGVYARRIIP